MDVVFAVHHEKKDVSLKTPNVYGPGFCAPHHAPVARCGPGHWATFSNARSQTARPTSRHVCMCMLCVERSRAGGCRSCASVPTSVALAGWEDQIAPPTLSNSEEFENQIPSSTAIRAIEAEEETKDDDE
jgi:hypothetical protein